MTARLIRSLMVVGWLGLAITGRSEAAVQTSLSYDYLGRVIQATHSGQTEDYYYSGEKRVFKKEASGKKRVYLYEDHSVVFDREVGFGKRGDADGNGLWTISDAVYLITYIFGGGPAPIPNILSGDADGTGLVTLSDVVKLINFIFAAGPAPSNETLSLPGAGYVEAPGAGRLWSDGAMGEEDLWYVEDPVSSTSAVLSGNQLVDVVHSTPFGEQLTQANLEKRYLFTGKELDATTGLFYYGARYYDPALGRFLQWDSVMDGPNRYLYVKNNPINANDPSGHGILDQIGQAFSDFRQTTSSWMNTARNYLDAVSSYCNTYCDWESNMPTEVANPSMDSNINYQAMWRMNLIWSKPAGYLIGQLGKLIHPRSEGEYYEALSDVAGGGLVSRGVAVMPKALKDRLATQLGNIGVNKKLIGIWNETPVWVLDRAIEQEIGGFNRSTGVLQLIADEVVDGNVASLKGGMNTIVHELFHAYQFRKYGAEAISSWPIARLEYPAYRLEHMYLRFWKSHGAVLNDRIMSPKDIRIHILFNYGIGPVSDYAGRKAEVEQLQDLLSRAGGG